MPPRHPIERLGWLAAAAALGPSSSPFALTAAGGCRSGKAPVGDRQRRDSCFWALPPLADMDAAMKVVGVAADPSVDCTNGSTSQRTNTGWWWSAPPRLDLHATRW